MTSPDTIRAARHLRSEIALLAATETDESVRYRLERAVRMLESAERMSEMNAAELSAWENEGGRVAV